MLLYPLLTVVNTVWMHLSGMVTVKIRKWTIWMVAIAFEIQKWIDWNYSDFMARRPIRFVLGMLLWIWCPTSHRSFGFRRGNTRQNIFRSIYCVNYHFRTVVFLPMAHAIRTPSHYWKWRNSWSLFCNNSRWDTNTKLHRWWKRGLAKMGVSLRYWKIWLSTRRTK